MVERTFHGIRLWDRQIGGAPVPTMRLQGMEISGLLQSNPLASVSISTSIPGKHWLASWGQPELNELVYMSCSGQCLWYKKDLILFSSVQFSSVQFSHSVVSNSLRPLELQHTRPPYPSPTPGVHSNSRPSSRWCHPAMSSSVVLFSSCPQSLPASESFPMSQLFAWGSQSTGASALASFLPKKSQGWSPLEWTGWIFLQPKGLSRVFSNTTVQKHQFFSAQLSSQSTLTSIHDRWKNHILD